MLGEKIVGIHELAQTEGKAAAADAAAEAIPQVLQADDPLVQVVSPRRGEPLPVPASWSAAVGQAVEGVFDAPQRDARGLGGADERHSPQCLPVEAPLVPGGAGAVDEAFGLVEVKGRDGDAATGRHLAHSQFVGREEDLDIGLDLNLT